MTPLKVSIAGVVASLLLIFLIFELVRSRRLRERYALLWLLTGIVMLVLSAWRQGLNTIAGWVGVSQPVALLFAVAGMFVILVLLHYSTVISKLADQNTVLAQRLALLEQELGEHAAPPGELLAREHERDHERTERH